MKVLVFIILGIALYFFLGAVIKKFHLKKLHKWLLPLVIVVTLGLFVTGALLSGLQPDKQCLIAHQTTLTPPQRLQSAQDYLALGDFAYEKGDCQSAITSYSKALALNPQYPEAYNNRAYTYMRMQEYNKALPDLDKAIEIRPNYVNALLNRGDIYNFYYHIDRAKAIADYDRVLKMSPQAYKNTSVCGHRLLAQNNGWHFIVLLKLFSGGMNAGCQ